VCHYAEIDLSIFVAVRNPTRQQVYKMDHIVAISPRMSDILDMACVLYCILFVWLITQTDFFLAEVNQNEKSHTEDSAEKLWRLLSSKFFLLP